MRPPSRNGGSSSSNTSRLLLALPLGLAAVALMLQFSTHHPAQDSAAYGLFK
jgi:hypothetical protein